MPYMATTILNCFLPNFPPTFRDTHIRQLKVFGPRTEVLAMGDTPIESFKTVEMQQYAMLRWHHVTSRLTTHRLECRNSWRVHACDLLTFHSFGRRSSRDWYQRKPPPARVVPRYVLHDAWFPFQPSLHPSLPPSDTEIEGLTWSQGSDDWDTWQRVGDNRRAQYICTLRTTIRLTHSFIKIICVSRDSATRSFDK